MLKKRLLPLPRIEKRGFDRARIHLAVGTTEKMTRWLQSARPDLTFPDRHGEESDIRISYCPERVMPGRILREVVKNDRIIGGMTNRCAQRAEELYNLFIEGSALKPRCVLLRCVS